MVESACGLGCLAFGLFFGVFVPFSTICLFFPSFNDDLGTMPTRRPYSWKKKHVVLLLAQTVLVNSGPFQTLFLVSHVSSCTEERLLGLWALGCGVLFVWCGVGFLCSFLHHPTVLPSIQR